jgi:toxin ParE1/3/4
MAEYRLARTARHIIYFRKTAYGIAIMRILHARMDAARHL